MRLSKRMSVLLVCLASVACVSTGTTMDQFEVEEARSETCLESRTSVQAIEGDLDAQLQDCVLSPDGGALSGERYRVLITTDLPTDTDDIQSLVHYFLVADLFDLEGIVSAPPTFNRTREFIAEDCGSSSKTACIHKVIDQYELDYANLKSWSATYPEPDAVRSLVKPGHEVSWEYSDEQLTEGSQWIVEQALKEDADNRPLYILSWGAVTNTATALKHHPEIADKIRIVMVGWSNVNKDQQAYDYILEHFPEVFFVESEGAMFGVRYPENADGYNGKSLCETISGKGAMGQYWCSYRSEYVDQDFVSVYYLMAGDPENPESEHWGGQYQRVTGNRWADIADPAARMTIPDVGEVNGVLSSSKWRAPRMGHLMRMFDRAASSANTKQNAFYELSLQSQLDHDPYASDFYLQIHWTLPDGSVRVSDGFYDGEKNYRARAYTSQIGGWAFRVESSMVGLNGVSGRFEVESSNLPGKLRKHAQDPFQFQYDNGDWFLHIGDTAYRYVNISEPDWKEYLEQADAAGFTKVRTWFNHARYDVQDLFADDRQALNIPYWQEIDKRLRYAHEYYPHIQFQLIPYGEDTLEIRRYGDDREAQSIARYAQARFSAYPNVQWCIVNDREIVQSGALNEERQVLASTINKIGEDMAAREPWGTLLTSHQARFEGYSFVDATWSDIITLEDLDQVGGDLIREYRNISEDDPVILDEDRYELYRGAKHPDYFFRRLIWGSLFAGGHATYGGLASYEARESGDDTKGVRAYFDTQTGSFPLKGADQFQFIHEFFKDADLTLVGFRPAQELLASSSVNNVATSNGQHTLVYIANPDTDNVETTNVAQQSRQVELLIPEGYGTKLSWFNPRTGEWVEPVLELIIGANSIETPNGGDWVALISP